MMVGVSTRLLARTFARPQGAALLTSRLASAAPAVSSRQQLSIRSSSNAAAHGKTVSLSQDESLELLNKQRSLLLYGWALGYLAAPYVGLDTVLSSAYLAEFASHMPFWLKTAVKAPFAVAASFHTLNGFLLSLRAAYISGYTVIAGTVVSTIGLCLL
ncbi:unnamed protein product [Tilletia caries]|nr:unnamed protein product [Tilletia caries]